MEKEFPIIEFETDHNHYYHSSNVNINKIVEFLETKKDELDEIKILYVFSSQALRQEEYYPTIFDGKDEELSKSFSDFNDFYRFVKKDYDEFFDDNNLNIEFQYVEYYDDYDIRIAEIYCIKEDY